MMQENWKKKDLMNANMTVFASFTLHENSLSIGRVKIAHSCLQIYLTSVVRNCHTFESNFGMKLKFTNYLNETCRLSSDEQLPFKYFLDIAFVRKIYLGALSRTHWKSLTTGERSTVWYTQHLYEAHEDGSVLPGKNLYFEPRSTNPHIAHLSWTLDEFEMFQATL